MTGTAAKDALLVEVHNAIHDEWMRPEHDPGCPGDERYCSLHCPVPFYAGAGFDQLLDAAVLATERVLTHDIPPGGDRD